MFEKAIQKFLSSPFDNQWVKDGRAEIYLRKSMRAVGDNMGLLNSLEIGNVGFPPELRGKGHFTSVLAFCEKINPFPVLFVENVHDERFQAFFRRNNWRTYELTTDPPSFYKIRSSSGV